MVGKCSASSVRAARRPHRLLGHSLMDDDDFIESALSSFPHGGHLWSALLDPIVVCERARRYERGLVSGRRPVIPRRTARGASPTMRLSPLSIWGMRSNLSPAHSLTPCSRACQPCTAEIPLSTGRLATHGAVGAKQLKVNR